MNRQRQDAFYVAETIRNFLSGSGGDWDWDDFISCPLRDAQLDGLRRRAASVELPAGPDECAILERLAGEADRLAQPDSTGSPADEATGQGKP